MADLIRGDIPTMIKTLEMFIKAVSEKALYTYTMHRYSECVIGVHVFRGQSWADKENDVLNEYFGIKSNSKISHAPFAYVNSNEYEPTTRKVIALFTTAHGNVLNKTYWLELAISTLKELKNGQPFEAQPNR